jgi:hypothetical protein
MKRLSLVLLSLFFLSSCSPGTSEEACANLQFKLAKVQGVLYKSDQLIEAKGFSAFTPEERQERGQAASDQTELYMKMDEIACYHD